MKSFTKARYLVSERKLLRAKKLIAEVQATVNECSIGDYMARDTTRVMYLRDAASRLNSSSIELHHAYKLLGLGVPGGVHNDG